MHVLYCNSTLATVYIWLQWLFHRYTNWIGWTGTVIRLEILHQSWLFKFSNNVDADPSLMHACKIAACMHITIILQDHHQSPSSSERIDLQSILYISPSSSCSILLCHPPCRWRTQTRSLIMWPSFLLTAILTLPYVSNAKSLPQVSNKILVDITRKERVFNWIATPRIAPHHRGMCVLSVTSD